MFPKVCLTKLLSHSPKKPLNFIYTKRYQQKCKLASL